MRWLTSKRLWQVASLLLFGLTLLFTLLWGARGIRPAIDCGLRDALSRGDLGTAWRCVDLADTTPCSPLSICTRNWFSRTLCES